LHYTGVYELMANTGALKGSSTGGVDPGWCYTGDVDDMFQLHNVYKSTSISPEDLLVAHCDASVRYVDKSIQTEPIVVPKSESGERKARVVNTYSVIQSVERKLEPLQHVLPTAEPTPSTRRSLRTSDEPTFIRDNEQPRAPWGFMIIPGRRLLGAPTSSKPTKHPEPRNEEVPATLQDSITRHGTPRNLTELELLSAALAKSLNLTPYPGCFDASNGPPGTFDLHEQLDVYGYTPRQPTVEPIDYGVALVGRLNFAPPVEIKEGKELEERV
jgi:hypothetical protein